ncbi:MAG: hypothetical protein EOO86_02440 [Pedobacter sp.]|nr:MAG: hypothetical protein EOO86_02440 [Pedobacter sp.]
MIEIKFSKNKLVTGVLINLAFIIGLFFITIYAENSYKPISLFLIFISAHIMIFHQIKSYRHCKKNLSGVNIDENGILNNTQNTPVFIEWKEIKRFSNGYFRAQNQIFIETINQDQYNHIKRNFYLTCFNKIGLLFRSKPDLLWIDVNLLNIKEDELLSLLRSELADYQKPQY